MIFDGTHNCNFMGDHSSTLVLLVPLVSRHLAVASLYQARAMFTYAEGLRFLKLFHITIGHAAPQSLQEYLLLPCDWR
jgi:hypothetical protein